MKWIHEWCPSTSSWNLSVLFIVIHSNLVTNVDLYNWRKFRGPSLFNVETYEFHEISILVFWLQLSETFYYLFPSLCMVLLYSFVKERFFIFNPLLPPSFFTFKVFDPWWLKLGIEVIVKDYLRIVNCTYLKLFFLTSDPRYIKWFLFI